MVRFLAAVSMLLYHLWKVFDPATTINFPAMTRWWRFHVLSGYLIADAPPRPRANLAV